MLLVAAASAGSDSCPPDGMSRSMGSGRKVYITRMGEPATEIIDIFDEAAPELIGTVKQRKEFHARWILSLRKVR
jgi:hypothetical protein